MTTIPSTAIEAAAEARRAFARSVIIYPNRLALDLAEARHILEASGLPADLQAAQESARVAEERAGELAEGLRAALNQLHMVSEWADKEDFQAVASSTHALHEGLYPLVVETKAPQLAEQLQEAREIVANLRTAAREVGVWFTFSGPSSGRFIGQKIGVHPETDLLSLHDYANDADIFLGDSSDTERLGETKP